MRLRTVVKLGTIVSVLLFCLAMGCYVLMRLDMTERDRGVNLFTYIPADCEAVLETDNIHEVLDHSQMLNYSRELESFRFPRLFDFLLNGLNEYAKESAHGLSNQMGHMAVSFHQPGGMRDQVIYLRMGMADEQMLADMLTEYATDSFLSKEEEYRGETLVVYPLGNDDFLTTYTEGGVWVISYQKRLVEQVIDAMLDGSSLADNEMFEQVMLRKKEKGYFTLYGRSAPMPFMALDEDCWSEYNIHMNSDVAYLTGSTFVAEDSSEMETVMEAIREMEVVNEEGSLLLSSDKDSTVWYMNRAFEENDFSHRTLFNECVSNLANDANFTLVADMEKVYEEPSRFQPYLPSFVLENTHIFRHFILSAQLSLYNNRPSHIWVFTYKN